MVINSSSDVSISLHAKINYSGELLEDEAITEMCD